MSGGILEKLEPWTKEQLAHSQDVQKIVMPLIKDVIFYTYNKTAGYQEIPDYLEALETDKANKILVGGFDEKYVATQAQVTQAIASKIDFFTYLVRYHVYASAMVNTLLDNLPKQKANQRKELVEVALKSIFSDAAVTMQHFFDLLENKAATEREEISQSFKGSVSSEFESVSAMIAEIAASSKALSEETTRVNDSVANANTAPDQVLQNVGSVAAATTELSATIGDITSQLKANVSSIDQVSNNVRSAIEAQTALDNATRSIQEITELISGIAGQTNLLALNATIEAARAGEAGRGFAIVAQEVKNLAKDTDSAIKNVTENIDHLRSAVTTISDSLQTVQKEVDDLSHGAHSIANAVVEQEGAASEIARSAETSTAAVEQMAKNAEMTASAAESSMHQASSTAKNALDADSKVREIKAAMEHFLATLTKVA